MSFSYVNLAAFGTGLLLGIIHFFSERLSIPEGAKRFRVISFAAGISIAYLFLDLLPRTYEAAVHLRNFVFIFLLLGFVLFHLAEKTIYQHSRRKDLAKELKEVHSIAFFIYHFSVGIVLYDMFQIQLSEGFLFLIPIALHASLSSASLHQIHGEMRESTAVRIVLSLSSLFGMILAHFIEVPPIADNILISLIAGFLLYIIVKEFLPEKEKGRPVFFVMGLLVFIGIFTLVERIGR